MYEKINMSESPNKKIISEYYDFLTARGISWSWRRTEITFLISVPFHFRWANQKKIINHFVLLEGKDLKTRTIDQYKLIFRTFWKWYKHTDKTPPEVDFIRCAPRYKRHLLPKELLTEDDIKKILSVLDDPLKRGFISALYYSGCRVGELITVPPENVYFDEMGAVMIVNGKTGYRRVRITKYTGFLKMAKAQGKKTLFPFDYSQAYKLCQKSGQLVNKTVYPHLFRHSRATQLAKHLTESQLRLFFGWSARSDMPAVYVHLSGRDIDKAICQLSS